MDNDLFHPTARRRWRCGWPLLRAWLMGGVTTGMIPGIDPKVDIAFKKVFGSQEWRHLTRAQIDAVIQPAPWRQLMDLELLNPYTEQMRAETRRLQAAAQQREAAAQQREAESQQREAAARERQATAERETRQELAHRVRPCERLLRRPLTDTTELLQRDALVLRELANDLERRLTRQWQISDYRAPIRSSYHTNPRCLSRLSDAALRVMRGVSPSCQA